MLRLLRKIFLIIALGIFVQCTEVAVPKPRGYFRITLPEHQYVEYDTDTMPYSFSHSALSRIVRDNTRGAQKYWVNIEYPTLRCKIHVTYLSLPDGMDEKAFEDSHRLAYKHTIMADAIGETYYDDTLNLVYATKYDIKGNAATPLQIALTDSLGHFFRGSLYFNSRPNKDSLAPVVAYINEDVVHLIETFRWKKVKK